MRRKSKNERERYRRIRDTYTHCTSIRAIFKKRIHMSSIPERRGPRKKKKKKRKHREGGDDYFVRITR